MRNFPVWVPFFLLFRLDLAIIGKAGKPVARLIRYEPHREPRRPGALKGKIKIADDFDVLPEDMVKAFGMEGE